MTVAPGHDPHGASVAAPGGNAAASRLGLVLGVVVVAVTLLVACRALVLGQAVGKWDVEAAYAHELVLLADFARAFELLLWNPLANGGSPEYLRDNGNLSPLNIALAFLIGGELMSFWKYWLAFWTAGGVGMLLLARHLGAPTWGALVVALGFTFSGFYTGHAEHTSYVVSASFLPWIVWRLDVALVTRSRRACVEAGALWGLGALSGYPAFAILTGGFLALWAAARVLGDDVVPDVPGESGARRGRAARLGAAAGACAVVLAVGLPILAPTYLGMVVEGAGYTDRSGSIPRAIALESNALHPATLSTHASPTLAMFALANPELWERTDPIMSSSYVGVLVPVLALLALLVRPRSSFRWGVLLCGLACLAAALGEHAPVRGWLYDFCPPTRYFRHAAIFRLYWIFSLCALAACGTRDLARSAPAWRRFLVAAVVASVAALLAFRATVAWTLPSSEVAPLQAEGWITACALWGSVCALGVAGLLRSRLRARALPLLLVVLACADGLQTVRLSARMMFSADPAAVRAWRALDERHEPDVDLTARGLQRELVVRGGEHYPRVHNAGYGSKTPTLQNYGPLANHWHERRPTEPGAPAPTPWIEHDVLRRAALGPGRTWFAAEAAEAYPSDAAYEAFARRSQQLGMPPLLLHRRADVLAADPRRAATEQELARLEELPAVRRIAVKVLRYAPRRLALAIDAPADGWLWVTDRWARGWSATVGGRPAEVVCANFLFRAVRVPSGPSEVVFTYRPFGFPWLLLASWSTLAAVLAWSLAAGLARARSARAAM